MKHETTGVPRYQGGTPPPPRTYLVSRQLRQELRIVGQGLQLDPDAVHVDAQQLRPVRREGNLFHAIAIDELDKVRIAHVGGRSVGILLHDGQVDGKACRRRAKGCRLLRERYKAVCLVGQEETGKHGEGELHLGRGV